MNCRDVTAILDDHGLELLDAARQRQVEEHVAACANCARAWHAQTVLATLPDLVLTPDFANRCRGVVATSQRQPNSRRVANRFLLGGAFIALLAAAAVVAVLQRAAIPATPDRAALVTADAVPPVAEASVVASVPAKRPAGIAPPVLLPASSSPLFTVRLVPPAAPPRTRSDAASEPQGMRDLREEIQRVYNDPPTSQALHSLSAALTQQLRTIPGLAMVDSDPAQVLPSSRNYRLRISFVPTLGTDFRLVSDDGRYLKVSLQAEQLQPDGRSITRLDRMAAVDLMATCSGAPIAADTACHDIRSVAAEMIRALREEVFPPDSSMTHALQAGFQDASLDPAKRIETLAELARLQTRTGDMSLLRDAGVVRAAIELAAIADPTLKAQIWRSMRGVGNTDLIEPLIASLLQDPAEARVAALETLAADFGGDPRVRSVLDAAAPTDSPALAAAIATRVRVEAARTALASSEHPIAQASLAPEFDPIFKNDASGLHAMFEREPRDESWAASTEHAWTLYFAANPRLEKYGQPTVQCRTSQCEVTMFAAGAAGMGAGDWFKLLLSKDMPKSSISRALAFHEGEGGTAVVLQLMFAHD